MMYTYVKKKKNQYNKYNKYNKPGFECNIRME